MKFINLLNFSSVMLWIFQASLAVQDNFWTWMIIKSVAHALQELTHWVGGLGLMTGTNCQMDFQSVLKDWIILCCGTRVLRILKWTVQSELPFFHFIFACVHASNGAKGWQRFIIVFFFINSGKEGRNRERLLHFPFPKFLLSDHKGSCIFLIFNMTFTCSCCLTLGKS